MGSGRSKPALPRASSPDPSSGADRGHLSSLADQPGAFCFLSADELRSGRIEKMPVYKDALTVPGLISKHKLDLRSACKGMYAKEYLAISHRWEESLVADSTGEQMQRLCEFLRSEEGARFQYVWVDFSCMPQHCTGDGEACERTPQEKKDFDRMLREVNLVYLGCFVLIIMDRSYLSRFWTQVSRIHFPYRHGG